MVTNTHENLAFVRIFDQPRCKANVPQPLQPLLSREYPQEMSVGFDRYWSVAFAEHVDKIHCIRRIGRVRIKCPLQMPQTPAFTIMTAVMNSRLETLAHSVGHEQDNASGLAVNERCLHTGDKIVASGHVT